MPLFCHQGSFSAILGPVPNLEPVSTYTAPVLGKEKWFRSGTMSLSGYKERTAYVKLNNVIFLK